MTMTREQVAHRLYVDGVRQQALADELGMHLITLRDWLKKWGLCGRVYWVKDNVLTKGNLTQWYVTEEQSMREIAEAHGVGSRVVRSQLELHGIALRAPNEITEKRRAIMSAAAKANPYFGIIPKEPNERGEYECTQCQTFKPLDAFQARWTCKACNIAMVKAWQAANPEQHRVSAAARIADEYGVVNVLTLAEWLAIIEELGRACFYCGGPFENIEHIVPMSQGGPNSKGNVVTSCRVCNQRKKAAKTDMLVALAMLRAGQLSDPDFEVLDMQAKRVTEKDTARADDLVGAVMGRLTRG
jgi:transposase